MNHAPPSLIQQSPLPTHLAPVPATEGRGALHVAMAICIMMAVGILALATLFAARNPGILDLVTSPTVARVEATGLILLDEVNESPRVEAVPADGPYPICAGVDERRVPALIRAFSLMRGTQRGRELFDVLSENDVCVTVKDIPYNGGYATSWRTATGDWIHGTITLDDGYITSRQADVLAAMLVHEATHIERAIDGRSCDDRVDCEVLSNGVELDEEIAAHGAEAAWWIAAYGKDGKRFAFGPDYGENELIEAYHAGPDRFREYVRDLRSDPREGAGI